MISAGGAADGSPRTVLNAALQTERPAWLEEPKRAFDFPDQIGGLAGVGGKADE
jgi:hypothetical protein